MRSTLVRLLLFAIAFLLLFYVARVPALNSVLYAFVFAWIMEGVVSSSIK